MPNRLQILLAEDDDQDVLLLRRAFEDAGVAYALQVAPDGQAAIDLLTDISRRQGAKAPALVLLDLKMPRRTGLEVLQWIRQNDGLRCLPVFIFSSSNLIQDVEPAYALGANIYLVKPSSTVERAQVANFIRDWLRLQQPSLAVLQDPAAARRFYADWLQQRNAGSN
jgi:CheY-like chemotaxis protein